jgi:hypothetical protein
MPDASQPNRSAGRVSTSETGSSNYSAGTSVYADAHDPVIAAVSPLNTRETAKVPFKVSGSSSHVTTTG